MISARALLAAFTTIAIIVITQQIAVCETAAPAVARVGLVMRDTARGDYLVWLEFGKRAGAVPGAAYDAAAGGKPVGTLWIDEVTENASAGHISPIAGAPKLKEGDELSLVRREVQAPAALPDIYVPGGKAPEVPAVPVSEASDKDMRMLAEFLKWSRKAVAPISTLVARSDFAGGDASGTKQISSQLISDYTVEQIDADIAGDIKSGYFIEAGDCVHISPWPEMEGGGAVVVGDDMKIYYPGTMFMVKGRSLLYLEKLVTDFIRQKEGAGSAVVSPCKVKSAGK